MSDNSFGKKFFAISGIILATAIWGTSFPIMKTALEAFTPLWFIGIRFAIASLIMVAICAKKLKRINKPLLRDGLIVGLPLSFAYAFQTIGLIHTTASNNAFITAAYVIFVPFIMWFIYKRIRFVNFAIAFVTFGGLAMLSLNNHFHIASGDVWTLGCAILLAVHLTLLGKFCLIYDAFLLSLIQIVMVAIVNTLLALFVEPIPIIANFSPQLIYSLLYCAILPTIVCYLLQTIAQRIISPLTTSVLMMNEAVFGAFFGWLLLEELFSPRQFIGAAILLVCMTATILLDCLPRPPGRRKRGKTVTENSLSGFSK